jgi:hypothetical protein
MLKESGNMQEESDNPLLNSIARFCNQQKIAESTFGRRAVNDGKFVSRLRNGSRVTPETWDRVSQYISQNGGEKPTPADPKEMHLVAAKQVARAGNGTVSKVPDSGSKEKNFRFFDNRQKYLLFVNTCSEKDVVARKVGAELSLIEPTPPAIRVFDAGMGDGTIITKVMREMHRKYPTMPFYISGKEVSLEDVRLSLAKMADRLFEHPATVVVLTNMYYSEAPWLTPKNEQAAKNVVWQEVPLSGTTAHDFDEQIRGLDSFLVDNWQATHSPKTGNPIYEKPAVLVLYREDYRFLLDDIIPRKGSQKADFDLVIASQPYRSRVSAQFKVEKVIAPLTRALSEGGRLIGVHSYGRDPALEIVQSVWPDEMPFTSGRHEILHALKLELGAEAGQYNFSPGSDARSILRYEMHALPTEISASIGTSTLFAAWNAAVYVAQIEDERLTAAMSEQTYLDATNEVLNKHGGLWFNDESYIISRRHSRRK